MRAVRWLRWVQRSDRLTAETPTVQLPATLLFTGLSNQIRGLLGKTHRRLSMQCPDQATRRHTETRASPRASSCGSRASSVSGRPGLDNHGSSDPSQGDFFPLLTPGPQRARGNEPRRRRRQPASSQSPRRPGVDDHDAPSGRQKMHHGPSTPPETSARMRSIPPKDAAERFKFQILINHLLR